MGLLSEILDEAREGFSASELLDSLRRKEPDGPGKGAAPEDGARPLDWYGKLTPEGRAKVRWGTSWKPGTEVPTGFKHGM